MNRNIKLVLSGSGTLYPVFVGAIKRLIKKGHQVQAICGTSGGAIVAAAIAGGMPIEDLEKLVKRLLPIDMVDYWKLLP